MKRIFAILLALALSLMACGTSGGSTNTNTNTNTSTDAEGTTAQTASLLATTVEAPDLTDATVILLGGDTVQINGSGAAEENGTVTITDGGVYVIKGTLDDGRVVVNASGEDVTLALENADITCPDSSPLYIYKAASVLLWLPEGSTSTLTDGGSYTFGDALSSAEEDEPNACLYSKADLIVAGTGGLTVNDNYNNGVTSKDNLLVDGVTLTVSGGTVDITQSCEGLEGATVDITGGVISVVASDDGINAAGGDGENVPGQANNSYWIHVSGGVITVDAGGDGIDSNGDILVSGGELYISGSTGDGDSAIDWDGDASVTGGVVVAAGSSGMAQNFGASSTQGSILVTFSSGSTEQVTLTDRDGTVLASFTPAKRYTCVVVSAPGVAQGGTYTITAGSQSQTVTMDSLIYGAGMGMGGVGGFPGGNMPSDFDPSQQGGGFPGGQRPSGDPPTKPN